MNSLPSLIEILNAMNAALDKKAACTISVNTITQKYTDARKQLVEAKNDILNEYNDLTKHPEGQKELGGNEASRSAAIEILVTKEKKAVESLEQQLTQAQGELTLSLIEVDRWRYTIQLLKIESESRYCP